MKSGINHGTGVAATSTKDDLVQELRQVNKRLLDSENLKSNFLSNIRNEINNPLASVLELSKGIAQGQFGAAQIKKHADLIYSEIFNLEFQLRNIFVSAELEAGESRFSPVLVNVAGILENLHAAFSHQLIKRRVNVLMNNNIPGETLFCTDPEKLLLVLSNIFSNAIQFSDEESTIEIHACINESKLVLSVLDYGMGISEQNSSLLFDRFRQGEEGSTKHFGGHGLGLSVSRALLELMNGEISVESELFHGSTFTVTIREGAQEDATFSTDGNDFLFNEGDALNF